MPKPMLEIFRPELPSRLLSMYSRMTDNARGEHEETKAFPRSRLTFDGERRRPAACVSFRSAALRPQLQTGEAVKRPWAAPLAGDSLRPDRSRSAELELERLDRRESRVSDAQT